MSLTEDSVSENAYAFMVGFLDKYPEFKGREFYITGESYAGHFIPAISHEIVRRANPDINLKGIAIGNGWTNPRAQYSMYDKFAWEEGLVGFYHHKFLEYGFDVCNFLVDTGLWPVAFFECSLVMQTVVGIPFAPNFNVYDIRIPCEKPTLCYDMDNAEKFLKRDDVQEILGVKGRRWTDCNMIVHTLMLGDWEWDLSPSVAYVLESGVDVLVYSGDKDWICNWRGGEAWTHQMDWAHTDEFQATEY